MLVDSRVHWLSTTRPTGQPHGTPEWHVDVHDEAFRHGGGTALVFEVAPTTAFGFAKGGRTRWRFEAR